VNILLAGINAKYIHSCLAVHSLRHYTERETGIPVRTAEYTINQLREEVLADIYRQAPDLAGFSCYIWNIGFIRPLIRELKQVLPGVKILLGGPEVSFDPEEALSFGADYVLSGEGEESFAKLCLALEQGTSLSQVPGLSWREDGAVRHNSPPAPLDLAKLPFVYEDLSQFDDRILYYEAQRGCPFNCQYCLSSVDKGVRFQPLEKVERELQFFLDHRVRQVKFVDRTFNASPKFAMAVWRFLHEHDNGVTNFHFELAAELLTGEMLAFLPSVRPGLFQFEIGVQTTHGPTLGAIDRRSSFEELTRRVHALQKGKNIHLHLDLIAGLPYESFAQFRQSFNDVYRLDPDQFQLGFLKLLKGSGLRRDMGKYGIRAREEAPYEVLYTDALPYSDMLRLKDIESLTDGYYNSCQFVTGLRYLTSLSETPFDFYLGFSEFCRTNGLFDRPPSRMGRFEVLYAYGSTLPGCDPGKLGWLLKYDLCSREKPKKLPAWMPDGTGEKGRIYSFYSQPENLEKYLPEYAGQEFKLTARMAHLEIFPFCPRTGEARETAVLFNYRRSDILGNASRVFLSPERLQNKK